MTTVQSCVTAPMPGRPLLKWAGGKRQLLPALRGFYPVAFNRYIEPFFGSGAVFFDLHAVGRLDGKRAWLVDDNADLIGCYRMLISRTDEVIAELRQLAAAHGARGSDFTTRFATRGSTRCAHHPVHTPELAAMLIYLNRTGFNGLFRLNKAGEIQCACGTLRQPAHRRRNASAAGGDRTRTRGVTLVHGSFDGALAEAGKGDFILLRSPCAPSAGRHASRITPPKDSPSTIRRAFSMRSSPPRSVVRMSCCQLLCCGHRAVVFDERRTARAAADRACERPARHQFASRVSRSGNGVCDYERLPTENAEGLRAGHPDQLAAGRAGERQAEIPSKET